MADSITLHVNGMTCGGCVRTVQTIIHKALDVDAVEVHVDLDEAQATFPFPDESKLALLLEKLATRGFPSTKQS